MTMAYDREFRPIEILSTNNWESKLAREYMQHWLPQLQDSGWIGFLKTIGADLVGMSTVPEVIADTSWWLRVPEVSYVTK